MTCLIANADDERDAEKMKIDESLKNRDKHTPINNKIKAYSLLNVRMNRIVILFLIIFILFIKK